MAASLLLRSLRLHAPPHLLSLLLLPFIISSSVLILLLVLRPFFLPQPSANFLFHGRYIFSPFSIPILSHITSPSSLSSPSHTLSPPLPRIVVSLSSFPGRLDRLNLTLPSLLKQTLAPSQIYLNVPKEVRRITNSGKENTADFSSSSTSIVPQFLYDLENETLGRFKVFLTDDYGPSTKLLPTLLRENDSLTVIITVDDDVEYHPDTLLTLVSTLLSFPNSLQEGFAPCWYCEEWFLGGAHRRYREGPCNGWLGAFGGAAYYRGWFDESIFEYERAPKGCRLHDDVWVSGKLRERGVRPYVMSPGFYSQVRHFKYNALSVHSVANGERDYRDPCIAHFNWFKNAPLSSKEKDLLISVKV